MRTCCVPLNRKKSPNHKRKARSAYDAGRPCGFAIYCRAAIPSHSIRLCIGRPGACAKMAQSRLGPSVAQRQALYRAARGLRKDGTIATWPSGESSNRQLVIARPGFKVRIPTASGYLGRVLVNTASASPQKADDSCAIPQKTTSLLFTQNLLHGLHNRQFDASGRPKEQSVRELGRSYNVSPNTISRVR